MQIDISCFFSSPIVCLYVIVLNMKFFFQWNPMSFRLKAIVSSKWISPEKSNNKGLREKNHWILSFVFDEWMTRKKIVKDVQCQQSIVALWIKLTLICNWQSQHRHWLTVTHLPIPRHGATFTCNILKKKKKIFRKKALSRKIRQYVSFWHWNKKFI